MWGSWVKSDPVCVRRESTQQHAPPTKFEELINKTDGPSPLLYPKQVGGGLQFVLSDWSLGTQAELDLEDEDVSA